MNRLEKRAWGNIAGVILCAVIAGPGIWWMVRSNTQGPAVLASFLASGLVGGLLTYRRNIKSWAKLDEREKKIEGKALAISRSVFVIFLWCASFIVFFAAGANNPVPAYLLPAMFLCGLFLASFVQSAVILAQFAKERYDE